MKRYPNIIRLSPQWLKSLGECHIGLSDGSYVPARPLGASYSRWRAAWLVWTGRADALIWPAKQ